MTREIFRTKPGQSVRFSVPLSVLGLAPTPLPTAVTLTLRCLVKGAIDAPIVDASPVFEGSTQTSATYHSDQTIPIGATPGAWARRWQATGGVPSQNGLVEDVFYVAPLDF